VIASADRRAPLWRHLDRDLLGRDGEGDTLGLSVDSVWRDRSVDAAPVGKNPGTGQNPEGVWEGLRIFSVSDPRDPEQIVTVYPGAAYGATGSTATSAGRSFSASPT